MWIRTPPNILFLARVVVVNSFCFELFSLFVCLFLICRPIPFSFARFCDTRISSFILSQCDMNIEAEIYPHKLLKMCRLRLEHLGLEFREKV